MSLYAPLSREQRLMAAQRAAALAKEHHVRLVSVRAGRADDTNPDHPSIVLLHARSPAEQQSVSRLDFPGFRGRPIEFETDVATYLSWTLPVIYAGLFSDTLRYELLNEPLVEHPAFADWQTKLYRDLCDRCDGPQGDVIQPFLDEVANHFASEAINLANSFTGRRSKHATIEHLGIDGKALRFRLMVFNATMAEGLYKRLDMNPRNFPIPKWLEISPQHNVTSMGMGHEASLSRAKVIGERFKGVKVNGFLTMPCPGINEADSPFNIDRVNNLLAELIESEDITPTWDPVHDAGAILDPLTGIRTPMPEPPPLPVVRHTPEFRL